MKQLLTLLAAAFVALAPAAANSSKEPEAARMETKAFQLDNFDALDISWIYNVDLVQSSQWKVEVEAPDFVMPYLQVKVRSNCLSLSVSGMPSDVRRKMERGSYKVHATVAMPQLTRVEMSGASKLQADGDFQTSNFDMELSGASSLKGLRMTATFADLECSGASKFQLAGHLEEIRMNLSGAARGTLESDGSTLNMDLSGSAKIELTGVYDKADMELSAASHVRMKGALGSLRLSGSGAAKLDVTECPANDVRLELSGASSARIVALDKLAVHLSGAASCHYKAGDHLLITETDVDRGASLRKL